MPLRVVGAVVIASLCVVGAGCRSSSSPRVTVKSFAFHPVRLSVHVGQTVTVANHDTTLHTFTADDGSFNTGSIGAGTARQVTFAKAGSYAYHCSIHVSMHGLVEVTGR
jgi:plastocyanin